MDHAVSFLTVFTTYSTRLSYGILMPEMIGALHISKAQAGGIANSFYEKIGKKMRKTVLFSKGFCAIHGGR